MEFQALIFISLHHLVAKYIQILELGSRSAVTLSHLAYFSVYIQQTLLFAKYLEKLIK